MNSGEDVQRQKARLRRRLRKRRGELDADEAARASESVCRWLGESAVLDGGHRLAGYCPLENEIDLRPFLARWMETGNDLCLPRVTGPGQMEFCLLRDWGELEQGAFGIDEPTGPAVSTDTIDIFLVPGLAFDRRGSRLGFGKGFYDRALPAPGRAIAIGVGHQWQLRDDPLPSEGHDRPMDHVVTDVQWVVVSPAEREG